MLEARGTREAPRIPGAQRTAHLARDGAHLARDGAQPAR